MADKLSDQQQRVLLRLDNHRPLSGTDKRGWLRAALFDPRTVRSLISRGLVKPSSNLPWMIKHNLDDMTVTITSKGSEALVQGHTGGEKS